MSRNGDPAPRRNQRFWPSLNGFKRLVNNQPVPTAGASKAAHTITFTGDRHLAAQWPRRRTISADQSSQSHCLTVATEIPGRREDRNLVRNQPARSIGSTTTGLSASKRTPSRSMNSGRIASDALTVTPLLSTKVKRPLTCCSTDTSAI